MLPAKTFFNRHGLSGLRADPRKLPTDDLHLRYGDYH
jgi:hypothetical protein